MKRLITGLTVVLFSATCAAADVKLTELDDRIRVEIGGKLFTEWRHKEWVAPFLYPVIGPNGESVTRHYPMKEGVPGESQDHAWHRSLRFAHSDVNGFNFWWTPGKERNGHTTEVKLERIERMTSGKTGELILWNRWLGDGKLVLRERVRLAFIPLEKQQLLMDYDVEIHAGEKPVTFGDMKDGGMLVRVAGTMKVAEHRTDKPFNGTILNSLGNQNREAWGKRAEWVDYFGPDASGQTAGIAMFDHPGNLRFPTHWHARTYGLLTANRFGTDHFAMPEGSHLGVICRPDGTKCPACNSRGGDYNIAAGESLTLRHRFYIHHGDTKSANVAGQYRAYTADPESTLAHMHALRQQRGWQELADQFAGVDFSEWPAKSVGQTVEALRLRGQAYAFTKKGQQAETDFRLAVKLASKDSAAWLGLADTLANNLNDDEQALAAYQRVLTIVGRSNGWMPISTTLSIARIFTNQVKPAEAIEALQIYGDMDEMAPVWKIKMLRAYGHAYAAQGKEKESLEKFREALELEASQSAPK